MANFIKLPLRSGLTLRGLEWGSSSSSKKVVCIHGWLDNANSFERLAPALALQGYHVIAYDNVGHGVSPHLSQCSKNSYNTTHYVAHFRDVLDSLTTTPSANSWNQPTVIGHSLGGFIATIFAGSHPDRVGKIVLIDGFTPMTEDSSHAAKSLRKALDAQSRRQRDPKPYETFQHAIDARMSIVSTYPGKQSLSFEAAKVLVQGSTYVQSISTSQTDVATSNQHNHPDSLSKIHSHTTTPSAAAATAATATAVALAPTDELLPSPQELDQGPVYFRHDPRLLLPSFLYLNNQQVKSFIDGIDTKVLLCEAKNGWPAINSTLYTEYKQLLQSKGKLRYEVLPGSHHLHLDPDTAPLVASTILDFLEKS